VSLVVCSISHGTHVAGIVSAYHKNQPACNGVAPGAQIVSLKVILTTSCIDGF
jgi:tripeptidyl-peptidase II